MTESTAVAVAKPTANTSVVMYMAEKYGMVPAAFEATLRATVCKGNVTQEEFAALLLVAKEYGLNPLTKELYAFPANGGGIVNDHPACDGIEFEDHVEDGKLISVTCRMYRKDRSRPTMATEYLAECMMSTDPWKKWPARMLRHKALIQTARYAFGFSGIVDEDEYQRMVNVTPEKLNTSLSERLSQATASTEGFNTVNPAPETIDPVTDAEFVDEEPLSDMGVEFDPDYLTDWANAIIGTLDGFKQGADLKALWGEDEIKARFTALKSYDEALAKRLHAAVNGRIKALAQ